MAPNCAGGGSYGGGGYQVDDDITQSIPIGFTFTYGATPYASVRIMSNGRLQFNNNYCWYGTNTVGPPPTYLLPYDGTNANLNNTMRVYGADFCPAGAPGETPPCAGTVYYTATPMGVAPNRYFVATWYQMKEWNSGPSLFNVQMILYENGDFVYQYKDISNNSQGAGQVGYQLSTADYGLVDFTAVNSLAYHSLRFFKPTPPLADYRLDECAGTTATDQSGNGYHGTLVGGMTVASAGRVCTADTLDGNTGYIALPAGFPKLGFTPGYTDFTIASWFNSANAGKSGQRIYVDDQNNTGGFAVSLGDGGNGMVRFFSRAVNPVIFDSPAVVSSNNWYFVVASHDATLKKRRLIIYDAGGNMISDTSQTYTGVWGSDAGAAAIGGENSASTESGSGFRFQGRIDETRIYSRVLADTEIATIAANEAQGLQRDGSLRPCPVCNPTLGNFNAFETSTAAGAVGGVIRTKIAGQSFATGNNNIVANLTSGNLDVVSLSGGALSPFTGNTTVQFLDAHDNSGAMDAKGCRTSWAVIATDAGIAPFTLTFAGQNRLSLPAKTPANSWPEVRVKIINATTPANYGCSNDAFAIRPSYINSAGVVKDADWLTSGVARDLNNIVAAGGNVHAAGKPFSLSGLTARNAVNATTTNFAGNPTLVPGNLILPDPLYCEANGYTCVPGSFTVGSWNFAAGVLSTTSAAYSEAGAFGWEIEDRSFSSVDAADSTLRQRYFRSNAVISTGRFVPASYQLNLTAPRLQTFCSAGSTPFTYLGQPFGYATPPSVTVKAMNGAATPVQTANYVGAAAGGIWKLATPLAYSSATCTAPTLTCAIIRQSGTARFTSTYALGAAIPGWDGTNLATQTGDATLVSANNGTGTLTFGATDKLALYRNPATPQAAYTAAVTLALQLDDYSESGIVLAPATTCASAPLITGNPTCIGGTVAATSMAFDPGATATASFRYGVLKLDSAYGSPLLPLRVPLRALYFDTTGWAANTADNCTALPNQRNNLAIGNQKGTLTPANYDSTKAPNSALTLNGGLGTIILAIPTAGTSGSADIALNLTNTVTDVSCNTTHPATTGANLSWLQGNWCGPNYDKDPSARISFGAPRAPYIYLRERY